MRYLLLLLMFLPLPALAAPDCDVSPEDCNCVAVVFHRPAQNPPDDLLTVLVPWADIDTIDRQQYRRQGNKRHKWLTTCVYYAQLGIQGGPTTYTPNADGKRLGLSYIAPSVGKPRPKIRVHIWRQAASANNDFGRGDVFMGALDGTENEGAVFENTTGRLAFQHMDGLRVGLIGSANATAILSGETLCLRETIGEVWDELLLNGCP